MRCLVVGGNGFIGQHVCTALKKTGLSVRILDIKHAGSNIDGVEYIIGSFTDTATLEHTLYGCDILIHLGWTSLPASSNKAAATDAESNIVGSVRMLEIALNAGVKRVVFASSGGTVYGHPKYVPIDEAHPTSPISAYGVSKLAVEKYLYLFHNLYGLETVSLRIANPYGEGQDPQRPQGAVTVFSYRAVHKMPIVIWGDGNIVRDYIHVKDVANAFVAAVLQPGIHGVFNIGTGRGTSLNSLLDMIESILGVPLERNYQPAREFDVYNNTLDIRHAKEVLRWTPKISLEDGVVDILAKLKYTANKV